MASVPKMEFEAMLSELNSLTALGQLAKYGQSLGRNTIIPRVPLTCEEPVCRLWPTLCGQVSDYRRMPAYSKRYSPERHRIGRTGWLRAAVLGANDGILSTASLVIGVATAHATHNNVLVAGLAGLVAGAMSMAAGEYVSVHSQADTEKAELERERRELKTDDSGEHKELAAIYISRGLAPELAKQVAQQLMAHDALGAHARDELGISETLSAHPIQAALASAASFAVGAAMPLLVATVAPATGLIPLVSGISLVFLALLGGLAARVGGAGVAAGAIRVTFWGALAIGATAGVGALFRIEV
jgi:VIT1/CCC1 family predicted Fe2+/Mn2+ transporter